MNARRSAVWRTCRVLANRPRLKIFGFINRNRGRTIFAVARGVNLSVVAASEYLRLLEAEGLVRLHRQGTWVKCWPADPHKQTGVGELITALSDKLRQEKKAIETVFKLATGFTHPRRVEVYQALRKKALTLTESEGSHWHSRTTFVAPFAKVEGASFYNGHWPASPALYDQNPRRPRWTRPGQFRDRIYNR